MNEITGKMELVNSQALYGNQNTSELRCLNPDLINLICSKLHTKDMVSFITAYPDYKETVLKYRIIRRQPNLGIGLDVLDHQQLLSLYYLVKDTRYNRTNVYNVYELMIKYNNENSLVFIENRTVGSICNGLEFCQIICERLKNLKYHSKYLIDILSLSYLLNDYQFFVSVIRDNDGSSFVISRATYL